MVVSDGYGVRNLCPDIMELVSRRLGFVLEVCVRSLGRILDNRLVPMSRILIPAQFDGYAHRKDKSFSLRFVTQEQTPQNVAHLHSLLDSFGFLHFKAESEISQAEKEELDALETDLVDNPRTQSQRIRGVLFRNWQQDPKGFAGFKEYYKWETDKIIQHYKSKLDP